LTKTTTTNIKLWFYSTSQILVLLVVLCLPLFPQQLFQRTFPTRWLFHLLLPLITTINLEHHHRQESVEVSHRPHLPEGISAEVLHHHHHHHPVAVVAFGLHLHLEIVEEDSHLPHLRVVDLEVCNK
jgi:hypothetical protein